MKHYCSTINGIVTTFSDIHGSAAKGKSILVHMERTPSNSAIAVGPDVEYSTQ